MPPAGRGSGGGPRVECELMLIRLDGAGRRRGALADRAGPRAQILAEAEGGVIILAAIGSAEELDELVERLRGFQVSELARTGTIAISLAGRPLAAVAAEPREQREVVTAP